MKHKYYDLMIRYAENPGIQIQTRDGYAEEWFDINYTPDWDDGEFRESPRTRHVHADLMIAKAKDSSVVFETFIEATQQWEVRNQRLSNHLQMRIRKTAFCVGDIVVFANDGVHAGLEIVVTGIDEVFDRTFCGTVIAGSPSSHPKGYQRNDFFTGNFKLRSE